MRENILLFFAIPVYSQFVLPNCPECSVQCGATTNPDTFSTTGLSSIDTGYYVFGCDAEISIETQKISPSLFTQNSITDIAGDPFEKSSTRDKQVNDCVQGHRIS